MDEKPLGLGYHMVGLECPDCGAVVVVMAELLTTRSSATDEAVTLRLKVKVKKIEHSCGGGPASLFDEMSDG